MKNQIIILKLGGSIITEKSSEKAQIKKAVVQNLAKELKLFIQRFPETKIILLHGAGSFGHPLVFQHKGFAEIVCSTRKLANLLTDIFLAKKLPVLPIQASAILTEKNGKTIISNIFQLKQIINSGFIPMMGGDMSLTAKNQAVVVSADKLAVLLAKTFSVSKIFFASDVDGVFEKFPPTKDAKPITFLSKTNLSRLLKNMDEKNSRRDVTGQMSGKLKAILTLNKKEIIIFNGLKPGNLTKALTGKPVGTRLIK